MGDSETEFGPKPEEENRIITMVADKYPLWEKFSPDINAAGSKNRGLLKAVDSLAEKDSFGAAEVDGIAEKFQDYVKFCRERGISRTFNSHLSLGWLAHEPKQNWRAYIIREVRRYVGRPEAESQEENNYVNAIIAIASKLTQEEMLEYSFFWEVQGNGNGRGPYYNGAYNYEHPEHSNKRIRDFYSQYSTPEHDLNDNLLYTLTSAANGTAQTPMYTAPILFDRELQAAQPAATRLLAEKYINILPNYNLYEGSGFDKQIKQQIQLLKEQYSIL